MQPSGELLCSQRNGGPNGPADPLPALVRADGAALGLRKLERHVEEHEAYRRSCLNMIASENIASPAVTRLRQTGP